MNTTAKSVLLLSLGITVADAQIPNFQHIVVIVQENRTPDNLFQGLCSPTRSTEPVQYDAQLIAIQHPDEQLAGQEFSRRRDAADIRAARE